MQMVSREEDFQLKIIALQMPKLMLWVFPLPVILQNGFNPDLQVSVRPKILTNLVNLPRLHWQVIPIGILLTPLEV
jgi:hypothetical protein